MKRAQPDSPRETGESGDQQAPLAVILTALSVEYQAVRAHLTGIETLVHASGTRAERGRLAGTSWYVALAEIGEGTLTAAALTERFHTWLRPQALFFVGVAGGLKDDIEVGDVVVATKVYGIHGGKQTSHGFLVRPEAWRTSHRLEQAARHALRGRARFKPIAVGDVVLADAASAIARHLNEHYNDAVAIEMEATGVAQAAHLTGELDALVIRGISNKADAHKHHRDAEGSPSKAAQNAAQAAVAVLRELSPAGPATAVDGHLDDHTTALLRAQEAACSALPYWPFHRDLPKLTDVYVEPSVISLDGSGLRGTLTTLLSDRGRILLLGPAGSGKSTAGLQMVGQMSGEILRGTQPPDTVPVFVPARLISSERNIQESISAACDRHLGNLLSRQIDIGRIAARHRLLIVVDGIDELVDPDERDRQITHLARHLDTTRHAAVITSRHFSENEISTFGGIELAFHMLPFDGQQLHQFVPRWMAAAGSAEPGRDATRFLQRLRHGAEYMLSSPLLTTMCLIVSDRHGPDLPVTRLELYDRFVQYLLFRRTRHAESRRQIASLLQVYGTPGDRLSDWLYDHRLELCSQVAKQYLQGDSRDLTDIAVEWIKEECEDAPWVDRWSSVVQSILVDTGMLLPIGAEVVFIHRSVAEYLAASLPGIGPDSFESTLTMMINAHTSISHFEGGGHGWFENSDATTSFLLFRCLWQGRTAQPAVSRLLAEHEDDFYTYATYWTVAQLGGAGVPLDDDAVERLFDFFVTRWYDVMRRGMQFPLSPAQYVVTLLVPLARRYPRLMTALRQFTTGLRDAHTAAIGLGGLWNSEHHDFAQAQLARMAAYEGDPGVPVYAARTYADLGQDEEAIVLAERAITAGANCFAVRDAVSVLVRYGRFDTTADLVAQAFPRHDWQSRIELAHCLTGIQHTQLAAALVREQLEATSAADKADFLRTLHSHRYGPEPYLVDPRPAYYAETIQALFDVAREHKAALLADPDLPATTRSEIAALQL
ncbi:NACHT domain-containing protein [Streptomyces sp. NPDC093094]|uniref:phosphorylase family protein n=1 Tax=Streptomyces sp. NPDC093094 TaxID=3366026 RepID=UPI00381BE0F6